MYISITGSSPAAKTARKALAVASTRTGGCVFGAAREYVRQPQGNWPQTQQAWERLVNAVGEAAPDTWDTEKSAARLIAAGVP